MSIGVSKGDLIDGNDYRIGDNIQFLNKSYLPPPCVYLGRLKGSRTHLTYHFDKQTIGKSSDLLWFSNENFIGCSDPSHLIFGINVGKRRIRHTMALKLNNESLNRLKIQIQSQSMSDPPLSDIDFKVKWLRTGLSLIFKFHTWVHFQWQSKLKKEH